MTSIFSLNVRTSTTSLDSIFVFYLYTGGYTPVRILTVDNIHITHAFALIWVSTSVALNQIFVIYNKQKFTKVKYLSDYLEIET